MCNNSPDILSVIEYYCFLHEIQIWQQLVNTKHSDLASKFKNCCSVDSQQFISEIESCDAKFSLSKPNIQLVRVLLDYFSTNVNSESFQQNLVILKQLCIQHNLYDTVTLFLSLHGKYVPESIRKSIPECCLEDGERINFPSFLEKVAHISQGISSTLSVSSLDVSIKDSLFALRDSLDRYVAERRRKSSIPEVSVSITNCSESVIRKLFESWKVPSSIVDKYVPSEIFDLPSLIKFDWEKLKEEGLPIGARKTLQREIQHLRTLFDCESKPLRKMSNTQVCYWLSTIGLASYIPEVEKLNLDGRTLLKMDIKALGNNATIGERLALQRAIKVKSEPSPTSQKRKMTQGHLSASSNSATSSRYSLTVPLAGKKQIRSF